MGHDQLTKTLDSSIEEHAFSGVISVRQPGMVLYERAAGYADIVAPPLSGAAAGGGSALSSFRSARTSAGRAAEQASSTVPAAVAAVSSTRGADLRNVGNAIEANHTTEKHWWVPESVGR